MKKILTILFLFFLISCETVPVSDRKQLILLPDSYINKQSAKAYQQFLQEFEAPEARGDFGLQGVLDSVFPIEDSHRNYILEYNSYYLKL